MFSCLLNCSQPLSGICRSMVTGPSRRSSHVDPMQAKSTMSRNHARRAPHYPRGCETSRRLLCLLLFPARQPAGVGDEAASRQSKMTASPDQPDFERVMSVR